MPMHELPRTSTSGLVTRGGEPVPLSGVDIRAEVGSFCARVTIAQRYVNREDSPIEAVYVFPLDEGAAVCGFEAVVDGTLVVGAVRERDQAFEMYDDAMARGDGAMLLDEERPDVFVASVGNLPPGKEVLLRVVYVTELQADDAGLRFTVPTTVSPRYAPPTDRVGLGRPDADTLNPPVAWEVPYGLNLVVEVAMPEPLSSVESPSHPIRVSLNGPRATITLSQADAALDRDFVLELGVANLDVPRAWIERDDEGNEAAAIGFYPRFEHAQVPSEIVFVVDRSGSMQGDSIEEVRNALQLCLRSMIPGCAFNIIGFGSTFQPLFTESRPYDDSTLAAASQQVAGLDADLGGTEVLPALKFALETPPRGSLQRQIIVLTDGQVTNTDAVLALAGQHADRARVFTFGIGRGASRHLVRGLARAGRGSAEFIFPGERIEPKVIRQFSRLLSPALTDVRVDWRGLSATQAPSVVPPVFAGSRLVLYAFLGGLRPAIVRLTAKTASGELAFDVPVDPGMTQGGRAVATLAARARIRELEEAPEWALARGSRQPRKENMVSKEIIRLSTTYGLISRETSFVAIERREAPVLGEVKLRRIPIALTDGWGGVDRMRHDAPGVALIGSSLDTTTLALEDLESSLGAERFRAPELARARRPEAPSTSRVPGVLRRALDRLAPRRDDAAPLELVQQSELDRLCMHALIALQRADGSWDLTSELAVAIGHDLATIEASVPSLDPRDNSTARMAWATALAVCWLQQYANAFETEWRAVADKSRLRLKAFPAPADGSTWLAAAARFHARHPRAGTVTT